MKKEELIRLFSGRVRRILEEMDLDFSEIHEIRLRAGDEVIITAYELYDGKIMGN